MTIVKIIGIAGTNGAGKDTVAEMLVERYNFYFASATDMLTAGLKERDWPIDRTHKSRLSAEWRRQYGMAAIVDRGVELYKAVETEYEGLVIGSLRHPGEVDRVHELGGTVVWVDADPKVRYDRIQSNKREGRKHEDEKTFEDFLADEHREMHPEGDAATLNGAAVKEKTDLVLLNNENNISAFKDQIEVSLKHLL